jgi:flavin-dependent thymidylate synthase
VVRGGPDKFAFVCGNTSPFEMTELKFHMGMPIFVVRQLVRHRMANLNEFSGRYSVMPLMFYTPPPEDVCYQASDNKQGRSGPVDGETLADFYEGLRESRMHAGNFYQWSLEEGVAKELARIDLPLSTYTFLYWKIDLRNLFHLIGLRSDPHAQKEIRAYSDLLAGIAKRVCPIAFSAFEDYQLYSLQFSQPELAAIRALSHFHVTPLSWDNPPKSVKAEINQVLKDYDVVGREAEEFWQKLRLQQKRDFDLDLGRAKPAKFFMDMVQEHSFEVAA